MSHSHPELSEPAALEKGTTRIVALGGLGDVGRNMTVFEHDGKILIVDAGVLFPEENQPGVDLILPDYSYLRERWSDVLAIVLTHAHEDHIGAVPFILREAGEIPLVGSRLTLALLEEKLKEHRIRPRSLEVKEGQVEQFGPFNLEFIAVNHSIPDALAISITTSAGRMLHTGDFKMDQLPLDGRLTDLATFAHLTIPEGVLIDAKQMENFKDSELVLICTGSQGEPMAALSRMASGDHQIRVGEGDTVILASSLIPGNENSVYRVINGLMRFGAKVVHKSNAMVHVSGHASAGELIYCYNLVKPKNVMPIHGEWRHLRANADLARLTGISDENIVTVDDGVVVDLRDGQVAVAGVITVGYIYVDGQSVGDITEASLKDRRVLGEEGFISIVVAVDSTTGKIVSGPDIHARGFAETEDVFDEVKIMIVEALRDAARDGVGGSHQLAQIVRRTVGQWVNTTHRRRPMILPIVVEV
ncbi:MAG: ribonuclease J [Actinobacteria bacterium]|nr:ribonuclease J [Actinomycetota bacterium]